MKQRNVNPSSVGQDDVELTGVAEVAGDRFGGRAGTEEHIDAARADDGGAGVLDHYEAGEDRLAKSLNRSLGERSSITKSGHSGINRFF